MWLLMVSRLLSAWMLISRSRYSPSDAIVCLTSTLSFPLILCFCICLRLPLHVAGAICTALLQRSNVVYNITGTSTSSSSGWWARVVFSETALGLWAPINFAVFISLYPFSLLLSALMRTWWGFYGWFGWMGGRGPWWFAVRWTAFSDCYIRLGNQDGNG